MAPWFCSLPCDVLSTLSLVGMETEQVGVTASLSAVGKSTKQNEQNTFRPVMRAVQAAWPRESGNLPEVGVSQLTPYKEDEGLVKLRGLCSLRPRVGQSVGQTDRKADENGLYFYKLTFAGDRS